MSFLAWTWTKKSWRDHAQLIGDIVNMEHFLMVVMGLIEKKMATFFGLERLVFSPYLFQDLCQSSHWPLRTLKRIDEDNALLSASTSFSACRSNSYLTPYLNIVLNPSGNKKTQSEIRKLAKFVECSWNFEIFKKYFLRNHTILDVSARPQVSPKIWLNKWSNSYIK